MFIYCICAQYLVEAPFALITASISEWHGGDQFVALLSWYGSPGFFDSGPSAHQPLLASQAHQHHGYLTNVWCFWQCGQVPNHAGK